MQSRISSLSESISNVIVGYGIAVGSQLIIFPLFGISIPLSHNFAIGLWFMAVSLVRCYLMRRIFNRKETVR